MVDFIPGILSFISVIFSITGWVDNDFIEEYYWFFWAPKKLLLLIVMLMYFKHDVFFCGLNGRIYRTRIYCTGGAICSLMKSIVLFIDDWEDDHDLFLSIIGIVLAVGFLLTAFEVVGKEINVSQEPLKFIILIVFAVSFLIFCFESGDVGYVPPLSVMFAFFMVIFELFVSLKLSLTCN